VTKLKKQLTTVQQADKKQANSQVPWNL